MIGFRAAGAVVDPRQPLLIRDPMIVDEEVQTGIMRRLGNSIPSCARSRRPGTVSSRIANRNREQNPEGITIMVVHREARVIHQGLS